jgi:hypothetical protein
MTHKQRERVQQLKDTIKSLKKALRDNNHKVKVYERALGIKK